MGRAPALETPHSEETPVGFALAGQVNAFGGARSGKVLETCELDANVITSVTWSRDDRMLAVATFDQQSAITIFGFDGDSRGSLREPNAQIAERPATIGLAIDDQHITAMAFAPGSNQLAVSTEKGIYLISPGGKMATECLAHSESAAFLDYAPDGLRLAAAYPSQRNVHVLDTAQGISGIQIYLE